MKKTKREKLVETILLYSDHSNPLNPQRLTRMAMATEGELIDILIDAVTLRFQPIKPRLNNL
jgi:hypothetical protein